ncbi:prepilin-type N-terminal cleavage/methylation domain-containing protein [Candidatus Gottesmanbacteria bacterium]|nr:prepilin-type N-terminal cleavage/methylation domain-containing protein [Candidatus Gottesmanbacteria bacterium]
MATFQKNNRYGLVKNLNNSGFTLLEIVIAMIIIAIVSGAVLGNFFSSLGKGRDSRRKQDLELIAKGLELFYNDHRAYPTSGALLNAGSTFVDDKGTVYMQKVPGDPKVVSGWLYDYDLMGPVSGQGYVIYACIENKNDPKRKIDGYAGSSCGCNIESTGFCNYAVSSANVSP